MATPTEQVCARLRAMGYPIPIGSRVERLYPGRWSGLPGQWSWTLWTPDDFPLDIGSEVPMCELLRCRSWVVTKKYEDTDLYPCGHCGRHASNDTHTT